jgi:hypothetical protein
MGYKKAVRYGGGTPELTQGTEYLLSGVVDKEVAMKILPDVMRYSTASGANPEDLAKIASAAIANFGIKPEELPLFSISSFVQEKMVVMNWRIWPNQCQPR